MSELIKPVDEAYAEKIRIPPGYELMGIISLLSNGEVPIFKATGEKSDKQEISSDNTKR